MMREDDSFVDPCGEVLGTRYELVERIGGGSDAMVYLATDRRTGGQVAVKVLHPDHAPDPSEVKRFVQEAQLAAQVRHPNLVRSHDFGGVGGWHYIVMELVQGKSLALCLNDGRIDPYRSARFVLDVLGAVGALHDHGIAHRDISPSNILIESVDGRERARLADLGIARKLTDRDLALTDVPRTKPTQPWGTLGYIAPECILGLNKNDYLADIYSVGAVWYKMITGYPPASLREGERGDWPRLVHSLENVPAAMRGVLLGALAPRDKRHNSAASMATALRGAMKPRPLRPRLALFLTPALGALVGLQAWSSLHRDDGDQSARIPAPPIACGPPAPPPDPEPTQAPAPARTQAPASTPLPVAAPGATPRPTDRPPSARPAVLAGVASPARPPRRTLRSALATCKSESVTVLEVVLTPGEEVEINGGPPFGDLGRCVLREVAKLDPPSKRTVLTL